MVYDIYDEKINLLFRADSYNASHPWQYPEGTSAEFLYIESRGAVAPLAHVKDHVFFGLQIVLNKYLSKPITQQDIDEAAEFFPAHGEPFNKEGWQYILDKYNGYIPITIKAVPEGMVVPLHSPVVTVECDDPKCFWVAGYFEALILKISWYGSTVATLSRECKKIIMEYLKLSCDDPETDILFKLHDFGDRGVSSDESAEWGGAAHLVNFLGSDTILGVLCANRNYDIKMAGFSIPAGKHGAFTAWGREREVEAYRNMIKKFGGKGKIFAVVSDAYDIYNACEHIWGEELRQEVIDSGAIVVIRPDSGDPLEVIPRCLKILAEKFGTTTNKKGFKVLKYVKLIQGDGITIDSIRKLCKAITNMGFSLENVNFGMGGGLLQQVNRDTLKFAMKTSATMQNGIWIDAFKAPVGDAGKTSRKGRISLYRVRKGHGTATELITLRIEEAETMPNVIEDMLKPVYINGKLLNKSTFVEVRNRASI
jgi:nicotinamide phosphoribosyltransferase